MGAAYKYHPTDMTPQQRMEAHRLFREATAANTSNVARWLSERTSDAVVSGEVVRMLAHAATLHDATPPRTAFFSGDPFIGREIGPFRVERLLGMGGMGRVYEAKGGEPPRTVALKVLARAALDETTLLRFEREARILAALDHPNVAKIIESGMVSDGTTDIPWLAMELVDGAKTIIEYSEEEQLPLRARIGLFASACDGVGAGHAAGFVHRDLKPQNILVGSAGQPKVIDFGVARTANGDISAATVRTDTGQLVGTMQYMSPEQFRADPRMIDRRVDVYSLGVVLFELLSGCHPYDVRGLPIHEAARIVCEGNEASIIDFIPDCDPGLEELVSKAMARERHLRYDDAQALAAAIRSWLEQPATSAGLAKARPRNQTGHSAPPQLGSGTLRRKGAESGWIGWLMIVILGGGTLVIGLSALGVLPPLQVMVGQVQERWRAVSGGTRQPADAGEKPNIVLDGVAGAQAGKATSVESIRVESDPPGAEVFLEGKKVGVTPVTVLIRWSADSENAELRLELDGYDSAVRSIPPDPAGKRTEALIVRASLQRRGQ